MNELVGTLSAREGTTGTLSPVGVLSGALTIGGAVPYERYDGEYVIEPTTEEQTLQTANKLATQNVVVKAIPRNYGLITWNGSYLTVS